jgi:acyl carrier protein
MDVDKKVCEIIAQQKRIDPERVTVDSSFEELGLDSLDAVNILFELEGAFDISIPDEKARQIKNVREMIEGVKELVAEKESA